jgi:hypothetical protein
MSTSRTQIDIDFDFRQEVGGRDPDAYSPTLKKFHQHLWNKPLPNGQMLQVSDRHSGYLLGVARGMSIDLSSDSIINSLSKRLKNNSQTKHIYSECHGVIEQVQQKGSTIGGFLLFPRKQIDGKLTINAARGFNRKIMDRFDLTLECIRRYYSNLDSPLRNDLERYSDFFDLFTNFRGYVQFFLLDDLVDEAFSKIHFFESGFKFFEESPLPLDTTSYTTYAQNTLKFVIARNERIKRWHLEQTRQMN